MLELQDIVIRYIGYNIELIFNFLPNNIRYPFSLCERIFMFIDNENGGMQKEYLNIFIWDKVILKRIIFNSRKLKEEKLLKFINNHPIEIFKIYKINNFKLNTIFNYLNNKNLKELTISQVQFGIHNNFNNKENSLIILKNLKKYNNLIKLNLSYTNLNNESLEFISNTLNLLKKLNISGTDVFKLHSIIQLKNLESFKAKEFPRNFQYKDIHYLNNLKKLKKLFLLERIFFVRSKFQIITNELLQFLNDCHFECLEHFTFTVNDVTEDYLIKYIFIYVHI